MGAKPIVTVVSNPTTTQRTGDWQVKSNGREISSHRTKKRAIKKAKQHARARGGQVRAQKSNGQWKTLVSY